MSLAERKALCLEMVAAWNRGDLAGIVEHWAPDIVHYSEDREVSSTAMIKLMEEGLKAFPDLRLEVKSIMAEEDRVALRITVTATHRGEFFGVAPTGRPVSWHLVEELRFAGTKVVEHWDVINMRPLLVRLGKLPDTGGTVSATGEERTPVAEARA
ncbi:ester cyclase [Streptomyces sp. NPDC001678]|uniref:ester cyclase n=1 Tax=Streptomyces sp. NPDC001678 TaxID=3364599 RepID=UPI003687A01B